MTPQDAVFLAIAAALLIERPKYWQIVCLAPLVAWGLSELPLGNLHALLVAVIVCLPVLRFAPVALLLALPNYVGVYDALIAATVWFAGLWLVDSMAKRLSDNIIPRPLRGAPIRLLTVGILYYILLPVFYLL
ncbi:MAG: hypothetical protein DRR19_13920 [Candidatus Parabeggiatoa sp. nov. 1]|nr:MAG: hypothetical protein DRR19_13920 [Gammaproteobacteria bacterium]